MRNLTLDEIKDVSAGLMPDGSWSSCQAVDVGRYKCQDYSSQSALLGSSYYSSYEFGRLGAY